MAITFGLFGTLVDADLPDDPAAPVARELRERGVAVPDDWADAYAETHVDAPEGAAVPLSAHVARALASRGVDAPGNAPRRAVVSAFDPDVTARPGADEAVGRAGERGPVGVVADCRVPELARRALLRSDLRDAMDAVVTGVSCGWRPSDPRAFEAAARRLDCEAADVVHVGTPPADEGVTAAGGRFRDASEAPLPSLVARDEP